MPQAYRAAPMETWELAAREAIRDTVTAYNAAGDRGRLDELAALFAVDGVLEVKDRFAVTGHDAIVETLGAATSRARPEGRFFIRHFVTNLHFVQVEPDRAQTTAYFLVLTPAGVDHWGRYRDTFVRQDDRWLFAHRLVAVDAHVEGPWYGGD
jgi:ketosteroid isomerase-like protein